MPTVCRPSVELPPHRVDLDELVDHFAEIYRNHERLDDALSVMRAGKVATRFFSRPLKELTDRGVPEAERMRRHYAATVQLAERAARHAVESAGVEMADIGCLISTSSIGYVVPGIDIHLLNRLSLGPQTVRMPVTNMGCGGGAFALCRAADFLAGPRRGHVLVVCSDVLAAYLHPADSGMDNMVMRGIVGDAAAACIVRRDDAVPGLRITSTWDYTVPGSSDIVGLKVGPDGMHGHNSPRLYDAIRAAVPPLARWFSAVPDFALAHPGGPKIMDLLSEQLGLSEELLRHSRASLAEVGNTGSSSLLDVISRAFDDPPASGDQGIILSIGPGIMVAALKARWS
ncbi:hypothetical protein [Streptomyces sp. NPDC056401]|uniref:hypothetical protein n=1 Tax=Streptomyces sp. NPDC056401 TaxID=3345809 RepID=UPI0035D65253